MARKKTMPGSSHFSTKEISFNFIDRSPTIGSRKSIREWLEQMLTQEGARFYSINYNFCSDKFLFKMNKKYLNHSFNTDIITFDLGDGNMEGDIYISIDRVKENSKSLRVTFRDELSRVMIHGLLHLCGYKDKTKAQQKQMRSKEDYYLSLRQF